METGIKKLEFGFTMVELLVVMTIIAILVGISLVSFDGIRKAARDGKRKADLESIRSALEIYRTDCRSYPATGDLVFDGTGSMVGREKDICAGVVYQDEIPSDSLYSTYTYRYLQVSANKYYLCAHLEGLTTDHDNSCDPDINDEDLVYCGVSNATCNYVVTNP